ncbi:MAG: hypothetical protein CMJ68_18105 [Planctomycetaceae bacterium]|nr:hypothetical protein [Planctomycetaceae bacterium]
MPEETITSRNSDETSRVTTPVTPRVRLGLAGLALVGLLGVVATLDAAGDYPGLGQGPGLTVDEMFNVGQGCRLARGTWYWMIGGVSTKQLFDERDYLPDHPPLGRLALGISHGAVTAIATPRESTATPFAPTAARFGSAVAFAWLIYLVGRTAASWYGAATGAWAALAVLLMPRLVAHAHLASLEMMITLAYSAAVLSLADRWQSEEAPSWRRAVVPGLLLGLALLTKIQAILLGPPVILWALWRFRSRAIAPLACWGAIGSVVFLAGWPWLWLDPVDHLVEYFARTTERAQLSVFYLGEKTPDIAAPWHYSLVMFAVTVPLGLHALAAWGLASRHWKWWADSRAILLVACSTFPLILFAVPGIAVYDGTRLFLVVFPLWAILVGRGAGALADWCRNRFQRLSPGGILLIPSAILVSSSWGLIATHPCGLSFYNLAVGGPAGAHSLGFETTYWGDSLTRRFLLDVSRHVPENDIIAVFPSLHPLQWTEFPKQVRVWDNGTPRLALYGTPPAASARWVMIFRRKADLPDFLRNTPPGLTPVVEVRRCGVLLAALYRQD